ncbi:MAG: hypothetical protein ACRDP6_35900 [Actinoallomurus sp.]
MSDIEVTVKVVKQADVESAAITKAATWFDADEDGLLADGRKLRVKKTGNPHADRVGLAGDVMSWTVDVTVGPGSFSEDSADDEELC